jgi:hypothetical protein
MLPIIAGGCALVNMVIRPRVRNVDVAAALEKEICRI